MGSPDKHDHAYTAASVLRNIAGRLSGRRDIVSPKEWEGGSEALRILIEWFYEGTMELRSVEETEAVGDFVANCTSDEAVRSETKKLWQNDSAIRSRVEVVAERDEDRINDLAKRLVSLAGLVETLDKSDHEDDKRIKRLETCERIVDRRLDGMIVSMIELRDSLEAHVLKTAGLMRSMDDTVMDQVELQRVVDTQSRLIRDLYELTGKPSRYAFPLTTFVKRPVGTPCRGGECKKDTRPDADDRAMDTLRTDHEAALSETDREKVENAAVGEWVKVEDVDAAMKPDPTANYPTDRRLSRAEIYVEAMRQAIQVVGLASLALPSMLVGIRLHAGDIGKIIKRRNEIVRDITTNA